MADSTIINLPANTTPATTDVFPHVDDPAVTPVDKKMTFADFLKVVNGLTEDTAPDSLADFALVYDTSASAAKKVQISRLGLLKNSIASVTTANVTGVVGTRHVLDLSGLTANRNFVLPAGAAGDVIEVNISVGDATYALVLIGDTSITINGGSAATEWSRLITTKENVRFIATSSTNWNVVMDGRIPCTGAISDTNAQNIDNTTYTKVTFDTSNADIGGLVDLANDKITVRRAGVYRICAQIYYHNFAASSLICQTYKNGSATGMPYSEESTYGMGTNSYGVPQVNSFVTLAAADYIELYGRQNSGSAQNPGMKPTAPALLNIQEILS